MAPVRPPRCETRERARGASGLLLVPLLALLVVPGAAVAYRSRLVHAVEAGGCTLRLEADDDSRTLRVRVSPEGSSCAVSREAVQRLLKEAFSRTEPPRLEGAYTSLYLGRLIDYPWLAAHLAAAAAGDARWDARKGRPVAMDVNAYVAMLLSREEVTGQLEAPIRESGYGIASASVEKVLVGAFPDDGRPAGKRPPGKVPFDAMVWFRLVKQQPG